MRTQTAHHTVTVTDPVTGSDLNLFYREAGPAHAPAILLLHGFPSSSHQYRRLIDRLATKYRVVAPDLPGFGYSDAPAAAGFGYSFDHLARITQAFTDAVRLERYALYLFDYGAPVGFRVAAWRPERVTALVSQNGNAYEEGLSDGWQPIRAYWSDPSDENRNALRGFLQMGTTQFQYTHGEANAALIAPESYTLDQHFLDRAGSDEIQLDLLGDYHSNLAAYPIFHEYFRTSQPPMLAVWGKNDPFFLPEGAEAFRRDLPNVEIRYVDGGHFPLESHVDEIADIVTAFLARTVDTEHGAALFGTLDEASVPAPAHPHLGTMRDVFGFVPALGYALAADPAVLGAYLGWLQALGSSSLSPVAQQVAMVAASQANSAAYGVAVHATLAGAVGAPETVTRALRDATELPDPALEAVRRFAFAIASKRTQVSDADIADLKAAGFDRATAVAIAMAVAGKTLANTVAHLAQTDIDAGFRG